MNGPGWELVYLRDEKINVCLKAFNFAAKNGPGGELVSLRDKKVKVFSHLNCELINCAFRVDYPLLGR